MNWFVTATSIFDAGRHIGFLGATFTMPNSNLRRALARLESLNDHLESELTSLDSLLRAVGFEEGVYTIRVASMNVLDDLLSPPKFNKNSNDKSDKKIDPQCEKSEKQEETDNCSEDKEPRL